MKNIQLAEEEKPYLQVKGQHTEGTEQEPNTSSTGDNPDITNRKKTRSVREHGPRGVRAFKRNQHRGHLSGHEQEVTQTWHTYTGNTDGSESTMDLCVPT